MAETKRVSDQYNIVAPIINIGKTDETSVTTVYGNLNVIGTSTSIQTTNSELEDNIIVLNKGETSAGVASGFSGIEIDRGSLTNVTFTYDESIDCFLIREGNDLINIRVAPPINDNDAATKSYVDTLAGSPSAAGIEGSVQYNSSGILAGDSTLVWDGFNLIVGDTTVNSGSIFTNSTNSDLELYANGSGTIYTRSVIKMENEISDPSSVSGTNQIYAKTPDGGGTGVYFVNSTASGEMVSKAKAIVFGIIF
jgi:hypothetical protein